MASLASSHLLPKGSCRTLHLKTGKCCQPQPAHYAHPSTEKPQVFGAHTVYERTRVANPSSQLELTSHAGCLPLQNYMVSDAKDEKKIQVPAQPPQPLAKIATSTNSTSKSQLFSSQNSQKNRPQTTWVPFFRADPWRIPGRSLAHVPPLALSASRIISWSSSSDMFSPSSRATAFRSSQRWRKQRTGTAPGHAGYGGWLWRLWVGE